MKWEVGCSPGVLHVPKLLCNLSFTSTAKAKNSAAGTKADQKSGMLDPGAEEGLSAAG